MSLGVYLKNTIICESVLLTVNRYVNHGIFKQARIMNKFLGKTKRRGPTIYGNPAKSHAIPMPSLQTSKEAKTWRRCAALNTIFMKHITDQLSMEVSSEILQNYGFEVTKVEMAPTYSFLNVYYHATSACEELEDHLKLAAAQLRHNLCNLQVIGIVPQIRFCQDLKYSKWAELEKIMRSPEYLRDTEAAAPDGDLIERLKRDFGLSEDQTDVDQLRNKVKQNNLSLDQVHNTEILQEESLPLMKHNALALDHKSMMNRIVAAANKARGPAFDNESDEIRTPKPVASKEVLHFDKKELLLFPKNRRTPNLRWGKTECSNVNIEDEIRLDSNIQYEEENENENEYEYEYENENESESDERYTDEEEKIEK